MAAATSTLLILQMWILQVQPMLEGTYTTGQWGCGSGVLQDESITGTRMLPERNIEGTYGL